MGNFNMEPPGLFRGRGEHPRTGKLLRSRRIDSIDPKTGDMVTALMYYDMPPGARGALPDILVADGENVYLRHLKIDPASLACIDASETPAAATLSPRKSLPGRSLRRRRDPPQVPPGERRSTLRSWRIT